MAEQRLATVRPNVGLEVAYQRKLERLIDEMHKSIDWWIKAAYRANQPEMAQDEDDKRGDENAAQRTAAAEISRAIRQSGSPAKVLQDIMRRLSKRWQKRFDEAAPELAKYFSTAAAERADGALAAILKKGGFSVKFKLTRGANDVLQANIGEQVGLIKSIASKHLSDVEGLVMRSVSTGRDLGTLSKQLQARYGITKKRAALIARDQNNKATATITRVRQQEMGVKTAVWMHSNAGKEPRLEHAGWNGKEYDVAQGMWSEADQQYVWPGTAINCRCTSKITMKQLLNQ